MAQSPIASTTLFPCIDNSVSVKVCRPYLGSCRGLWSQGAHWAPQGPLGSLVPNGTYMDPLGPIVFVHLNSPNRKHIWNNGTLPCVHVSKIVFDASMVCCSLCRKQHVRCKKNLGACCWQKRQATAAGLHATKSSPHNDYWNYIDTCRMSSVEIVHIDMIST
jgi:hypothetical protein